MNVTLTVVGHAGGGEGKKVKGETVAAIKRANVQKGRVTQMSELYMEEQARYLCWVEGKEQGM